MGCRAAPRERIQNQRILIAGQNPNQILDKLNGFRLIKSFIDAQNFRQSFRTVAVEADLFFLQKGIGRLTFLHFVQISFGAWKFAIEVKPIVQLHLPQSFFGIARIGAFGRRPCDSVFKCERVRLGVISCINRVELVKTSAVIVVEFVIGRLVDFLTNPKIFVGSQAFFVAGVSQNKV